RYRATISVAPNFAYDLCVSAAKNPQQLDLDLSTWRVAGNAAEPVRPLTLERFSGRFGPCGFDTQALLPGYGLAEATLAVTMTPRGTYWHGEPLDAESLRVNRI